MKLLEAVAVLSFLITPLTKAASNNNIYYSNKKGGVTQEDILALNERCGCANSTVSKIKQHLDNYKKSNGEDETSAGPNVDGLINEIKEIAQECTSSSSCRCPEGYFKSKDHRCLSFSRQEKTCREAVRACQNKYYSRLAVAKDPESLLNLQTYLKMADQDDHFYWIGLSYNKDEQYNHAPNWKWEDSSYATSHTKASMGLYENANVKKAAAQLRMVDIKSALDDELVRVAIKGDEDFGLSFEAGFCGDAGDEQVQKYRYICEFLMFQVDIRPSNHRDASDDDKMR